MTRIRLSGIASMAGAMLLCGAPMLKAQQAVAPKPKMKAAAIKVTMIESNEIKLPAEFQVSLYEDLIAQLKKKGGLPRVYREGDKNADSATDLIVLRTTVTGFKEGNERLRQVTTVAGATSVDVHCAFTDKDGKTLLEQDIKGNVRFFGANLRATFDFAKKTAQITRENFSPTAGT
jgi:Domain of unknown function (DUF4410)